MTIDIKKLIILLFVFLFVKDDFECKVLSSALTYTCGEGRVGDQLFHYSKAKWISYKYNIPLYYKPFEYSDKLYISLIDKSYSNSQLSSLKIKKLPGKARFNELNPEKFIYIDSRFNENNTLYVIDPYFFPAIWKNFMFDVSNVIQPYDIVYTSNYVAKGRNKFQMRHDEMIMGLKQDSKFIKELRRLIKPIKELKVVDRPKGIISVAVHVRIGGGFDGPHVSPFFYESDPHLNHYVDFISGKDNSIYYKAQRKVRNKVIKTMPITDDLNSRELESDVLRPLKHVPMQFYVDQIKGLSAMLNDVPLFVHIFTDQPNPSEIKEKFEQLINKKNIIFACRGQGNSHNSNVLEDLFSMSEFDCLIRPYSSLSQVAELLGNHKIVISPYNSLWYQGNLIIDEVRITINNKNVSK